jgi:putative transposase
VTEHPTAAWTVRQIIEAFPEETGPQYILRDRDAIYGEPFTRRVDHMGIARLSRPPGRPGRTPSRNG